MQTAATVFSFLWLAAFVAALVGQYMLKHHGIKLIPKKGELLTRSEKAIRWFTFACWIAMIVFFAIACVLNGIAYQGKQA